MKNSVSAYLETKLEQDQQKKIEVTSPTFTFDRHAPPVDPASPFFLKTVHRKIE